MIGNVSTSGSLERAAAGISSQIQMARGKERWGEVQELQSEPSFRNRKTTLSVLEAIESVHDYGNRFNSGDLEWWDAMESKLFQEIDNGSPTPAVKHLVYSTAETFQRPSGAPPHKRKRCVIVSDSEEEQEPAQAQRKPKGAGPGTDTVVIATHAAHRISAQLARVVAAKQIRERKKRPPLEVTKETILRALKTADVHYFETHYRTKKGTVNKQFASLRETFATVGKNSAGHTCIVDASLLVQCIYRFAASARKVAREYHAILQILLTKCEVSTAGVGKKMSPRAFLEFVTLEVWRIARKAAEPVRVDDQTDRHAPWRRRWLANTLLQHGDPAWLAEADAIAEALCFSIDNRCFEFYTPLLEDSDRMARLTEEHLLRVYTAAMLQADSQPAAWGLVSEKLNPRPPVEALRQADTGGRFAAQLAQLETAP